MVKDEAAAGRILVVDDDIEVVDILRRLLRSAGHEVRTAGDGYQTISLIESWKPHLVLLDVDLSPLDGLEVVRRLKSDPTHAAMAVVAMTASIGNADRAYAAGCDAYILKPIDAARVVSQVANCIRV